ncbi:MAG: hypothetical protein PHR77_15550 [Kiritimatiellae bacterium]|nr:hypothetical protein [Kiritimatiellia bacterium]MDD5521025.1 hypothetical protein [Kiritimatiellia bacterium]
MDGINILAKSSSNEPHTVYFGTNKGKIVISCDCQAGIHRQLCKHKIALAAGDKAMLYDVAQENDLTTILSWIKKTKISDLLAELNVALHAETEAKERVSKLKKKIGNVMNEGMAISE